MTNLTKLFQKTFNTSDVPRKFFAPGRINLIGEHTDYNGGHVFPASISLGTYALGRKRTDNTFRFYSLNFSENGIIECTRNELSFQQKHAWANYPKGMIQYIMDQGYAVDTGADILFYGNIPNGAGLSSSASIELATGVLLEGLFHLEIDRIEMIQIGQRVENKYIGVNSGIMDQFAIGMGKKDNAMLLDCQTLNYQYAPTTLQDYTIIIINTNKQRTLTGSKYNERFAECREALAELQKRLPIQSLGELSPEQFEDNKHAITNKIHQKRAKHAVYENARTLQAFEELHKGDLPAFGALMNESHRSLQNDYEVTGLELDTIVHAAWEQEGVIGARMTGAGFGGCAIAIIHQDFVDNFKQNVNQIYQNIIGYDATFYLASIADGAKEIMEGEIL
ncbi:galactokinase [Oceanobacillus sojae]|uniref:galactokinase n=1 Tax=Oceanobacillus sojae TaxID=582851 RepID=UPI0021A53511|nr:galactokinase [Oceanobacillus sojae]MCT1902506.1 galactokinase [Oceanobacillus sojae]